MRMTLSVKLSLSSLVMLVLLIAATGFMVAGEQRTAVILSSSGVVVSVLVMLFMHRHVVRPLSAVALALGRIGDGHLEVKIPDAGRRSDEIADMLRALRVLRDHSLENLRLREARQESR